MTWGAIVMKHLHSRFALNMVRLLCAALLANTSLMGASSTSRGSERAQDLDMRVEGLKAVQSDPRFISAEQQAVENMKQSIKRLALSDPSASVVADAIMVSARRDFEAAWTVGESVGNEMKLPSPVFPAPFKDEFLKGMREWAIREILEYRAEFESADSK